jgi:heptosyltransferase-2
VDRLLVVAPNWLGDAVMALPAIADVVRAWPRTALTVAARSAVAPLFEMVPGVGAVVPSESLPAGAQYEAALLLTNSFHSALTVWRAGIPERWGYRRDLRGPLLTRAVAPPIGVHQAAYYQQLVQALGFASGPLEPAVSLTPAISLGAKQLLAKHGWDGATPLVAFAPGAAYGSAKRWPAESFAAAVRSFQAEEQGAVIVGSAADRSASHELRRHLGQDGLLLDLVGQTDLPSLAGVLAQCRALVSNDSGAAHLAAALGLPVTVVFGPTDERATHPIGRREPVILTHEVWCRPCMLRECPLDHRCMRLIDVDRVVTATWRSM